MVGSWSPVMWLLLLLSVTIAVCLVAILGNPNPKTTEVTEETEGDDKFESFFSGEKAVFSQVGGSDLFWGFKHNWRKYFSFMHDWHSGVVNDYALYGATAIAVVLALCVIFL
jgi:multicomponent Na+:H+ antiporter subunit D